MMAIQLCTFKYRESNKATTLHGLKDITNPTYETKKVEKLDNPVYTNSSAIKMDNCSHQESVDNEVFYDVVQINTDKKLHNEDNVIIDVNPSYGMSSAGKVNDNLRKAKRSNKPI